MNGKQIFLYLFFELWLIAFTIFSHTFISKCVANQIKKFLQKWPKFYERYAETIEKSIMRILDSMTWLILYWNSGKNVSDALHIPHFFDGFATHAHRRWFRYRTLDYFVLNPPSQLVLRYHWLAFWIGFVYNLNLFFMFENGKNFRKDAKIIF